MGALGEGDSLARHHHAVAYAVGRASDEPNYGDALSTKGSCVIFIVTKNRVRRKYADDWISLVSEFTTATRAEPGNLFFDWYRSVDDPTVYVLVEAFVDRAAGEVHVNSDHFKAATVVLSESLAAVPEIINVEVPDGWSRVSEGSAGGSDA
jgi:quinol monooxygenase YgiN